MGLLYAEGAVHTDQSGTFSLKGLLTKRVSQFTAGQQCLLIKEGTKGWTLLLTSAGQQGWAPSSIVKMLGPESSVKPFPLSPTGKSNLSNLLYICCKLLSVSPPLLARQTALPSATG